MWGVSDNMNKQFEPTQNDLLWTEKTEFPSDTELLKNSDFCKICQNLSVSFSWNRSQFIYPRPGLILAAENWNLSNKFQFLIDHKLWTESIELAQALATLQCQCGVCGERGPGVWCSDSNHGTDITNCIVPLKAASCSLCMGKWWMRNDPTAKTVNRR